MDIGSGADGAWRVRGVRLPDGAAVEEWWISGGVWRDAPVTGARDLPGGWFLPGGLVDAHAHLTMNLNRYALPDGSPALIRANLAAQRAAGVLAVRDAGLAWGGQLAGTPPEGPRVQAAGRLLAAPGRGYPQICHWVHAERLVETALAEVRAGATWVKVMADFPGADGNWFAAPPSYPADVLAELVEAVHAAGARVMGHSTGLGAANLVSAGVDTVEHGMQLDDALLEEMARRGIAWSLTLATALRHVGSLAALDTPVGRYIRGELARVRQLLPRAATLGVPLLAGTDELPHGAIVEEVSQLRAFGLAPVQALAAASTGARAFLGLPGLRAGSPGDVVTYAADPRDDPAALTRPATIVFAGARIDTPALA
jgi:imidazolonepropionase-like amidohydrolase